MNIDLTHLSLLQLLIVLLITAAVDTLTGIVGAVMSHTFTVDLVATYLETHVLKRVFPILGVGFLAQSLGGPEGAGAVIWAGALLSLGAYVAETVASVQTNLATAIPPAPPAPPVA